MIRRLQFATIALMILFGCVSAQAAGPGTVSGWVRDSAGVPQVGAVVQLLRADQSVILSVFTDAKGHFAFSNVYPGRYAVKAMGATYLPAMRENLRVHANLIVNLTLNTLFEVMQWLPAEPRGGNAQPDDWAWTLRSAANRPLLRWLEDGPLVVVSDGRGSQPRLKARLLATGQAGTFGESGERFSASVEDTPSDSRELLARVDFDPGSRAGMESMLGFKQDLGYSGSVQAMAAVLVDQDLDSGDAQGLNAVAMRSWQTIHLGDLLEAETGSEQVVARFSHDAPETLAAALPFASLTWRNGADQIRYRMSSFHGAEQGRDSAAAILPALSAVNGHLRMERGVHQEVGWERQTENTSLSVRLFADRMENPVLEAAAQFAANSAVPHEGLFDQASNLIRVAGPGYSAAGMVASVERRLPGGNQLRLSYANGNALALSAAPAVHPTALAQVVADAHPHHAQMYALSLSGTLEGTGTRWHATYRWQPENTMTAVAPDAPDAHDPYFNLHLRQTLRRSAIGSRIEAQIDLRNLLAQGYQPFVLSDGSLLVFAQDQRSFRGGLALIF